MDYGGHADRLLLTFRMCRMVRRYWLCSPQAAATVQQRVAEQTEDNGAPPGQVFSVTKQPLVLDLQPNRL
ncbi:MAG: hypothetical protein U5K38_09310 [Woeseiaceae bacterium]|nr:hypothetical protein [Woeseiaceae bacterium]